MVPNENFPALQAEVLPDLDAFIAKCKDPETPFYSNGEGAYLNILQIRDEIRQGTELGIGAAQSWKGMRAAEKKQQSPGQ